MSDALAALRDGVRRVNRAPALLFGVWITMVAATLAATVMERAITRDLAHSIAMPLQPTVSGVAALLDDVSMVVDHARRPAPIVAMAIAAAILWLFLAGGIIDRYARDRATRSFGFFGASGVFFFRFLRLAILQVIAYGLLFGVLDPWLSARADSPLARLAGEIAIGALVGGATLVFDYTRVRAVVEDRRSMIGALVNALGFVRRHFAAAVTLYLLDTVLFVGAIVVYGMVTPDVGGGALAWVSVVVGETFLAVRLWVKLLFWASETALFQMQLAHVGYVARPEPLWPESPAAEAVL